MIVSIDTPVVQQHGNVEHEAITAGIVKVENAAKPLAIEQSVVVEKVGVNGAPWQGFEIKMA